MNFVPHISRSAVIGLAMAGFSLPAVAGGISPGNGGSIVIPSVLPPSVRDTQLHSNGSPSFDSLGRRLGIQDGSLDFFSVRPDSSGDFKPFLHGGVGDRGLQLQLKW